MKNRKEKGLGKKLIAILTMTVFLMGVLVQPALALDFGVYTASTPTNYLNPDTGVTEDGGTQNVELGEGMCRSAVDKTALIEVDADGNIYVTMRMLLYSNLSKIKFYTQAKSGGSYSAVSASITAEDAANDSADFRIKVPKAGCNVKTTMYVAPMGRDVTFFWNVNAGTAKAGSGDFVVNIDLNAKPKAEEPAAPATATPAKSEAAQPAATSTSHTDTAKANTSSSNTSTAKSDTATAAAQTSTNNSSTTDNDSKTDAAVKAENQAANNEPTNDSQEEELQEVEGTPADENNDADGEDADEVGAEPEDEGTADADADAEDGAETEPAETESSLPIVPIVCVVVVVIAVAGYFVMKRK